MEDLTTAPNYLIRCLNSILPLKCTDSPVHFTVVCNVYTHQPGGSLCQPCVVRERLALQHQLYSAGVLTKFKKYPFVPNILLPAQSKPTSSTPRVSPHTTVHSNLYLEFIHLPVFQRKILYSLVLKSGNT